MALIDHFWEASRAVQLKEKTNPATLHGSLTAYNKAPAQVSICVNACAHSFLCACKKRAGRGKSEEEKREGEKGKTRKDHKMQKSHSNTEKGQRERQERNKLKHYLFWQPPSPPRSSEKFLRFHQHQLNHKEKRHSPISTDIKKEGETEGGRETDRERVTVLPSAVSFSWPLI